MNILIVGINYTQDGARTIVYLSLFNGENSPLTFNEFCDVYLKEQYDEVYTIEMDNNHREFIDYIVTHGCRM